MNRPTAALPVMLLVALAVLAGGVATALAAPGAITGLASPGYSTASFPFSWNPVAGIAGYAYTLDRSPDTLAGTTVALSALSFAASQVTVGSSPWQVVTGDFGNGQLDLAVLNEGASSIRVLLGNGHGSFAAKVDYPVVALAEKAVIGDFNGDGIPDLAVINNVRRHCVGKDCLEGRSSIDLPSTLLPAGVKYIDCDGERTLGAHVDRRTVHSGRRDRLRHLLEPHARRGPGERHTRGAQ